MAEVTRTARISSGDSVVEIDYTFQYDDFDYPLWDPWEPETDPLHVDQGGSFSEDLMELVRQSSVVVRVVDSGAPSVWLGSVKSGNSETVWNSGTFTAEALTLWRVGGQIKQVGDIGAIEMVRLS